MKNVTDLLKSKAQRQMVTVKPEDTVLDAIKLLAKEDVGAAVVVSGGQLVGIFSERDYTRKIVLKGRHSETTRVEEIMTANVICVTPRTKTRDCMALMSEKNIRHLPVVDGDKVLGLISMRDIMADVIADHEFTINQLETYVNS